jgi:hypothetical protein
MSITSTAPVEAASPRSSLDRSAIELAGQMVVCRGQARTSDYGAAQGPLGAGNAGGLAIRPVTNRPARPTKSSTVPPRPGAYRRPALAGTSKPTRRRRLFWLTIIVGIVSPVAQATAEGPFYEATQCYYWLHVHAQDGIIHIESPTVRAYSLGDSLPFGCSP